MGQRTTGIIGVLVCPLLGWLFVKTCNDRGTDSDQQGIWDLYAKKQKTGFIHFFKTRISLYGIFHCDLSHTDMAVAHSLNVLMHSDGAVQVPVRLLSVGNLPRGISSLQGHAETSTSAAMALCRHSPEPATQFHPMECNAPQRPMPASWPHSCICTGLGYAYFQEPEQESAASPLHGPFSSHILSFLAAWHCQQPLVVSTTIWILAFDRNISLFIL